MPADIKTPENVTVKACDVIISDVLVFSASYLPKSPKL